MKLEMVVAIAVLGCGKSESTAEKPMDPPKLSAAGDVTVPAGHETTYSFGGKETRMQYSWLEILQFEGKPAFRLFAQGGRNGMGLFSFGAVIPPNTPNLDALKGVAIGAWPTGVSFGNAPDMATGMGGTITIEEVTPTYVAGKFEAQACPHGERQCASPTPVTNGNFKAFRSALSDDAAFARYTKQ